MQDFDDSFLSWVWRGIGLAAGFFTFSVIVGLILVASAGALWQSAVKAWVPATNAPAPAATSSRPPSSSPVPSLPRRVYIEARSREECLELTRGVANERYAQCRKGYWTTQ